MHDRFLYLGVSLGLCKLNLEIKQFSRWLLHLFSICILLADQVLVGLLVHRKEKLKMSIHTRIFPTLFNFSILHPPVVYW